MRICLRADQRVRMRSFKSISSSELDGDGVFSDIGKYYITSKGDFLITKGKFFNDEFHELGEEHGKYFYDFAKSSNLILEATSDDLTNGFKAYHQLKRTSKICDSSNFAERGFLINQRS